MIARLLNVVNVCGCSFIWILFFCKRHILWSKDSTICNTLMFRSKCYMMIREGSAPFKSEAK